VWDINLKLNEKMNQIKARVKSVRIKLFLILCVIITLIIMLLVIVNSVVLEKFYLYNKTKVVKEIYHEVNNSYNNKLSYQDIEKKLKIIAINNNIDILIKTNEDIMMLTTDKFIIDSNKEIEFFLGIKQNCENIKSLYEEDLLNINLYKEKSTDINYIVVTASLENGYEIYMRMPTTDLQENARISNNVLLTIGFAVILISGFIASFVSDRFTKPILELDGIAQKMCNLDFSQKYIVTDGEDEINNLGKSINTMSDKLENTIKQLTINNTELEKDVERKSKIDEMRKQFISDVSHELKTPIALIQGYAEGLVEDVNTDDESRQFYANVILDEANKMDRLVKQLLELMKLEYGKRDFRNECFDIISLIDEVIKKCNVMLEENGIDVIFESNNVIMVYADSFYIEQVITNYLTNAIKHCKEVNDERKIEINVLLDCEVNKVRVSVFNTGEHINENELQRIWGRFYKTDSSRNRENGGTGIGLAFVKAIMSNYKNEYGAINKEDGVEFFFDLDLEK